MTARTKNLSAPAVKKPITHFGPDFPFAFDDWISHPAGLGTLPPAAPAWPAWWRPMS
jgi:hypothetical protein